MPNNICETDTSLGQGHSCQQGICKQKKWSRFFRFIKRELKSQRMNKLPRFRTQSNAELHAWFDKEPMAKGPVGVPYDYLNRKLVGWTVAVAALLFIAYLSWDFWFIRKPQATIIKQKHGVYILLLQHQLMTWFCHFNYITHKAITHKYIYSHRLQNPIYYNIHLYIYYRLIAYVLHYVSQTLVSSTSIRGKNYRWGFLEGGGGEGAVFSVLRIRAPVIVNICTMRFVCM